VIHKSYLSTNPMAERRRNTERIRRTTVAYYYAQSKQQEYLVPTIE